MNNKKALLYTVLLVLTIAVVPSVYGQSGGCNQNGAWPTDSFNQFIAGLMKISFSSDRLVAAMQGVSGQNYGLNGNQTVQVLQTLDFTAEKTDFVTNMSMYMLGLNCSQVVTVLGQISFSNSKLEALPSLVNITIDLAANNQTILTAFSLTSDQQKAQQIINSAVPLSCLWGVVTSQKRVLFIVDKSGSMDTQFVSDGHTYTRLQFVNKELSNIIAKILRDYQLFNVMYFSDGVSNVFNGVQPVNPPNIAAALKFVQSFKPYGGTNMLGALQSAVQDKTLNAIFLLSDGQPNPGQNSGILAIANSCPMTINTISFQAGGKYDPQAAQFMFEIAQASGGVYRSTS